MKKKTLWIFFFVFQETELSFISSVIKTDFLIFLVLKNKNSCFFPRRTPQQFSFFAFFSVHYLPFSGISIIHLSRVFSFFTFLRYFCVAVPRVLRIWESFFYSQAFFTLHSFPTFATTCIYQGFPGSR